MNKLHNKFLLIIIGVVVFGSAIQVSADKLNNATSFCIDGECFYGRSLGIPVNTLGLSEEELNDESVFASMLDVNIEDYVKIYNDLPETYGGKLLDVDVVRCFYPLFNDSEGSAGKFTRSTHIPASYFIDYIYYEKLCHLKNKGGGKVILMAGGDGSGKSTAIKKLYKEKFECADIIKDGTMRNFDFYQNLIKDLIEDDLEVELVYIFRSIEKAMEGSIQRAIKIGRARPIVETANAHYHAQANMLKFYHEFGEQIKFTVVNNESSYEDIEIVEDPINFLKQKEVAYISEESVLRRAWTAYNAANKTGLSEESRLLIEKGFDQTKLGSAGSFQKRVISYFKTTIKGLVDKLFSI